MANIRQIGRDIDRSLSAAPRSRLTYLSPVSASADDDISGDKETSYGNKAPKTLDDRRLAKPKSDKRQADISGYEESISRLDDGIDGDRDKLALAAKLVDDQIGDESTIGDQRYYEAVKATYDSMNPSVDYVYASGDIGAPVRQLNDAINNVTYTLGSGIDWLWDNTAGNLAGVLGEEAKQDVSDFVTPENASIAADILIDLGLGFIPGIGTGLALAKGLVQNSENIYEGLTGRDDITGRELEPGQRLAKAALGIGGTLLDVVPGLGKASNAGKLAKTAIADMPNAAKRTAKIMDGLSETTRSAIPNEILDPVAREAARHANDLPSIDAAIDRADTKIGDVIGRIIPQSAKTTTTSAAPGWDNLAKSQAPGYYKVTKELQDEADKQVAKAVNKAGNSGVSAAQQAVTDPGYTSTEIGKAIDAITKSEYDPLAKRVNEAQEVLDNLNVDPVYSPAEIDALEKSAKQRGGGSKNRKALRQAAEDAKAANRRQEEFLSIYRSGDPKYTGSVRRTLANDYINSLPADRRDQALKVLQDIDMQEATVDNLSRDLAPIGEDINNLTAEQIRLKADERFRRANRPVAAIDNAKDSIRQYPGMVRRNWNAGKLRRAEASELWDKGHPLKSAASYIGGLKQQLLSPLPRPTYMDELTKYNPDAGMLGVRDESKFLKRDITKRDSPTMRLMFPSGIRNNLLNVGMTPVIGVMSEQAEHGGSLQDSLERYGNRLDAGGIPTFFSSYFLPSMLGAKRMSRALPGPRGNFGMFDAPGAAARAAANIHFYNTYPTGGEDEYRLTPEDYEDIINSWGY